jgi:hypothetical protein
VKNDEEKDAMEQDIISESIVSRISSMQKPGREKRETKYIKNILEKHD